MINLFEINSALLTFTKQFLYKVSIAPENEKRADIILFSRSYTTDKNILQSI